MRKDKEWFTKYMRSRPIDLEHIVRLHSALASGRAVVAINREIVHLHADKAKEVKGFYLAYTLCRSAAPLNVMNVSSKEEIYEFARVCSTCTKRVKLEHEKNNSSSDVSDSTKRLMQADDRTSDTHAEPVEFINSKPNAVPFA